MGRGRSGLAGKKRKKEEAKVRRTSEMAQDKHFS